MEIPHGNDRIMLWPFAMPGFHVSVSVSTNKIIDARGLATLLVPYVRTRVGRCGWYGGFMLTLLPSSLMTN